MRESENMDEKQERCVTGDRATLLRMKVPAESMEDLGDGNCRVPWGDWIAAQERGYADDQEAGLVAAMEAAGIREIEGGIAGLRALAGAFEFFKLDRYFEGGEFDADAFAADRERGGSGFRHAALFILSVWNARGDWPPFSLSDAMAALDHRGRGVIQGWCVRPWWP